MRYTCILVVLMLCIWSACLPLKSVFLAAPDAKDLDRSPKAVIKAGEGCFQFKHTVENWGKKLKVNDWTKDIPFFVNIEALFKSHATRSCVIIRKDTVLYEYYGEQMDTTTQHASYSIAKSVTSILIGIAIDEQKIESEQDLVIKYLPELKEKHPYWSQMTLEHLLNHSSGIKYSLALDATIYYGDRILNALNRVKFAVPPGARQHYININVLLLGLILEKATGMKPSAYLSQKIWQPMKACNDAIWSTDQHGVEKTYCCMGATALDYAKFGRLLLHQGKWENQQLFSEDWYQKSIRRDTSNGSSFNYNYCWHIGTKAYGDFMAIGMYKQHIYIHPKKEIIIVLLNNRERLLLAERVVWWNIFQQIVDQ